MNRRCSSAPRADGRSSRTGDSLPQGASPPNRSLITIAARSRISEYRAPATSKHRAAIRRPVLCLPVEYMRSPMIREYLDHTPHKLTTTPGALVVVAKGIAGPPSRRTGEGGGWSQPPCSWGRGALEQRAVLRQRKHAHGGDSQARRYRAAKTAVTARRRERNTSESPFAIRNTTSSKSRRSFCLRATGSRHTDC
jgi:hypothetical protein